MLKITSYTRPYYSNGSQSQNYSNLTPSAPKETNCMYHFSTAINEVPTVTIRVAQPDELTENLAEACGKLMPYMYPEDLGGPVNLDRLHDVGQYPSTLIIATLGEIAFTNTSMHHAERTDAQIRNIPFPTSPDTSKQLAKNYPVIGQAIVHHIGGFRDGRDWLEDLVVHPDARGGSPSIGDAIYDTACSISRDRGSRALFFVSAPRRAAAHKLYKRSGAVVLAGNDDSPTNLFVQNHR